VITPEVDARVALFCAEVDSEPSVGPLERERGMFMGIDAAKRKNVLDSLELIKRMIGSVHALFGFGRGFPGGSIAHFEFFSGSRVLVYNI